MSYLHGETRVDPYHYLANREHPDTAAYLLAEQAYTREVSREWEPLRREIEREINAALPDHLTGEPLVVDGYEYIRTVEPGSQYPRFLRRALDTAAEFEVFLDANKLAGDSAYYALGNFSISPGGDVIAYTEDRTGDQQYSLKLMPLNQMASSTFVADGVGASVAWHTGGDLFYVDLATRSILKLHAEDATVSTVYRETDPAFTLRLTASRDTNHVLMSSISHQSSEIRLIDQDGELSLVLPRSERHQYRVRIHQDQIFLITNQRREDFELGRLDVSEGANGTIEYFAIPIEGRIEDFEIFDSHFVVQARHGLQTRIYKMDRHSALLELVVASQPGAEVRLSSNPNPASGQLRVRTSQLTQPLRHTIYDLETGAVVDESGMEEVSETFNSEQLWFEARDGVQVPVTLLFRELANGGNPGYITAYGAYGISMSAEYDPSLLPLLSRGYVYARIHVRGGGELGPAWHEAGRYPYKQNAVNDFVDGTRFLINEGYIDPQRIAARGASAGATLVAAAVGQAPELYRAYICDLPFVDLVNTLLDDQHPLTASDRAEWGDPNNPDAYRLLKGLSPYEQPVLARGPDLLVTAALNDRRVYFSEPLKWVARMRAGADAGRFMMIDIAPNTGHLGASDQYDLRRKDSLEYAFIFSRLAEPE